MNTTKQMYDAIIVGTGPSGAYAAYLLAKADLNVLLIEKDVLPRSKICGGGLSRKTMEEIEFDLSPVIHKNISGVYLTYKSEMFIRRPMDKIGSMVHRSEFDHYLVKKAISAGAKLAESSKVSRYIEHPEYVEVITSQETYHTKYLIGADGVKSVVRSNMHPDTKPVLGYGIEAYLYPKDGALEFFGNNALYDIGGIPSGYGWIFPKKDHFNIGLFKSKNRPDNKKMRDFLKAFIDRNASLRDYKELKIVGYPIPLKPASFRLAVGRVALVGDAAGMGESVYGEGIYYAVKSAKVLSSVVISSLKGNTTLWKYNVKLFPQLVDLYFSRIAASLVYRNPAFGFYQMARNKWVNYYFTQLIYGKVSYMRCVLESILLSPLWIFFPKYKPVDDKYLK